MGTTKATLTSIEKAVRYTQHPIRLPPLPSTGDLLRLYKVRAQRYLSQNFLLEPRLCTKLIKAAGNITDYHICEIGPGPGNLTRPILERGAKHVTVIEKDKRFLPFLEMLADSCHGRMTIDIADIMDYNESYSKLFPNDLSMDWHSNVPNVHIIGNLPFNVSTPLIIRLLKHCANKTGPFIFGRTKMTLTFQKEVAERMIAPVLSSQRCRLSIMCQYLCKVQHKITIPGSAFVPKPEVDVGVVHFIPLKEPLIKHPFNLIEKVTRNIFHHRQKHCKHVLPLLFPEDLSHLAEETFRLTGIDLTTRPYALTIDEIGKICDVYSFFCEQHPGLIQYDFRNSRRMKKSTECSDE